MAHEVEHRAKNALAVVAGLLRMTKAASAEELAQVMEGRVLTLSRTITLLGQGRWLGKQLRAILQNELAPFEGDGRVLDLSRPTILIDVDAAQPLAMALHELATNAAKFGALSEPSGRLEVRLWIEDTKVKLVWRETGGLPVVGPPRRTGFGSQLITMLFGGKIGGDVRTVWDAGGLVCHMSFPLRPPGTS